MYLATASSLFRAAAHDENGNLTLQDTFGLYFGNYFSFLDCLCYTEQLFFAAYENLCLSKLYSGAIV